MPKMEPDNVRVEPVFRVVEFVAGMAPNTNVDATEPVVEFRFTIRDFAEAVGEGMTPIVPP